MPEASPRMAFRAPCSTWRCGRFPWASWRLIAAYFIWYGLGRSWLEAIRIDPTSDAPLGIPANIWASFAVVVLGIAIFVVRTVRHRGEPDSSPFTVTPQQRQDAEALSPAGS